MLGTCEDCGCDNKELMLTYACERGHNSNTYCCQKYTCKNGCEINCDVCNAVNTVKSVDGFFFQELCIACKQPLSFSFMWFGPDLKKACDKYCTMGCFKNKQLVKLNTKYKNAKYQTFLAEIENFLSQRLRPEYFIKLKFKTVEELNKSLNRCFPNEYEYMLYELFSYYNNDINTLNNKTIESISEIWNINDII